MSELASLFNPASVAVVGASRNRNKVGNIILRNIISSGYAGRIFPINPKEKEIENYRAYPTVTEVPEQVDLAVISLPAQKVLEAAESCGRVGVKNLIVISAGFKETGKEGLDREKQLVDIARQFGMRVLGPNCVGMMDTHTPLNASFAAGFAKKGEIAFISQSGAMLVAILDWSFKAGLGFSKFVSLGNKADLNEADFIANAAEDPFTKVILCYIEDVGDGSQFLEIASQASRKKPVVILKSGSSQAGAQAASSHTGALAGSDLAYEVAFRQSGVIRARDMAELFDLAIAFSSQPIPGNDRVAVVTNAGGPGIIATDMIEKRGLDMARFSKDTIKALQENLPREANIYNPVDVLGDGKADRYEYAMNKVLEDENVGSMVVLVCPTATAEPIPTADAIIKAKKTFPEKPVCAVYMGGKIMDEAVCKLSEAGVPTYTFPEVAVSSIKGLVTYAEYRSKRPDEVVTPLPDIDRDKVKKVFQYVKQDDGRVVLLGSEAAEVAEAYGIPVAPTRLATKPEEAVAIAEEIGYPVVLKVASPKIVHKTDIGGVRIGLQSPAEVMAGYWAIMGNVQRSLPNVVIYGIEVQKMAPKGTELIIGMSRDVTFGPLIAFGLGGIYVNLLKDVAFRLAYKLNREEIKKMIFETKAYTLLRGYRGDKPADLDAIENIIQRVAALVVDFPEIAEMDINPVFAYPSGATALDIKITIS
ncbi:MAG: acetate--CoA ligase family protein [Peptococcaceae bacterium]|nr:acetate--CoA ligase family protein [Peptococcaceae bacterium]